MKGGSDGYIQGTIQEVADAVTTTPTLMNLEYSPAKSELSLISSNERD